MNRSTPSRTAPPRRSGLGARVRHRGRDRRAGLSGCATVPTRSERHGAAGQQQELRALPGRRRGLPPVGLAAGRNHRAEDRDREHGRRRGDRHRWWARRPAPRSAPPPAIRPSARRPARASGLLGGTAIGASRGDAYGGSVQRRYDMSYTQCMYAKGNQVPMARGSRRAAAAGLLASPPPPRRLRRRPRSRPRSRRLRRARRRLRRHSLASPRAVARPRASPLRREASPCTRCSRYGRRGGGGRRDHRRAGGHPHPVVRRRRRAVTVELIAAFRRRGRDARRRQHGGAGRIRAGRDPHPVIRRRGRAISRRAGTCRPAYSTVRGFAGAPRTAPVVGGYVGSCIRRSRRAGRRPRVSRERRDAWSAGSHDAWGRILLPARKSIPCATRNRREITRRFAA